MRVFAKATLWTIAVFAVIAGGLALYLFYGDLSRHQGRFEDFLADAIGYDVRIDGAFDLTLSKVIQIKAENVHLLHADTPDLPSFVSMGEISVVLDTGSLYEGPVVVERLELENVQLHLASDVAAARALVEPSQLATSDESPTTVIEIKQFNLRHVSVSRNDLKIDIKGAIRGSARTELGNRPVISLDLASSSLDIKLDVPMPTDGVATAANDEAVRVFSDAPFDPTMLDLVDLELSAQVDELTFARNILSELTLVVNVAEGRLRAAPVSFRDLGAKTDIELELRQEKSGLAANLEVTVAGMHMGTLWSPDADRTTLPTLTGSMSLRGEGESLHRIMAASSGETTIKIGPGRLQSFTGTGLFGDIILQVLRTLNPLRHEDPYTSLECAVFSMTVVDGAASIGKFAVQTDKMLIVADGEIQLEDESLNLSVRAKPREGLGISLGGVANSFVRLGGVLASPELKLDAAGGVTTAGAAVVTGGLSLVARGLWDRISAENDLCNDDVSLAPVSSQEGDSEH